MEIKKNPNSIIYNEITKNINANQGYCVCELEHTDDTKCMCKKFRETDKCGFCSCGRYYKVREYPVITLCGSTRFKDVFLEIQKQLTLQGWIVLTVGLFGHSGDNEVWSDNAKALLDDLHKAKIAMSDAIFVINKDGYIGESTRSEIEWAQDLGKDIYYLESKE